MSSDLLHGPLEARGLDRGLLGPPSAEPEFSSAQTPLSGRESACLPALLNPVFNLARPAHRDAGQPGGRSSFLVRSL